MLGRLGFWGLRVLAEIRLKTYVRHGFVAVVLGAAAVTLAACGRAGPPEPPPGPLFSSPTAAAVPPPGAAPLGPSAPPGSSDDARQKQYAKATQNGFDTYGNPVAPASEKKSFFLDFLLQ
jgi:putative lipoprotein